MKIDLHNHTSRCNHAIGTIDEYIKQAIKQNIDIFGFSEHAPMDFDAHYRLSFEHMIDYTNEIKAAREKYHNEIDIRLGYEVDWLPGHMDERVLTADVDYLIGSVHFLDKWGFDNPEFIGEWTHKDVATVWHDYFSAISEMADSGLFDIVGHLDLIKVFGHRPDSDILSIVRPALEAIHASGMVIELNTAGLRKDAAEIYPSLNILQEAYAMGIPITFGSDAHSPQQVGYGLDLAYEMASSVGYDRCVTFQKRKAQSLKF